MSTSMNYLVSYETSLLVLSSFFHIGIFTKQFKIFIFTSVIALYYAIFYGIVFYFKVSLCCIVFHGIIWQV